MEIKLLRKEKEKENRAVFIYQSIGPQEQELNWPLTATHGNQLASQEVSSFFFYPKERALRRTNNDPIREEKHDLCFFCSFLYTSFFSSSSSVFFRDQNFLAGILLTQQYFDDFQSFRGIDFLTSSHRDSLLQKIQAASSHGSFSW